MTKINLALAANEAADAVAWLEEDFEYKFGQMIRARWYPTNYRRPMFQTYPVDNVHVESDCWFCSACPCGCDANTNVNMLPPDEEELKRFPSVSEYYGSIAVAVRAAQEVY